MAVDQRTIGERVSDAVTGFGGSWKFIISFSVILVAWIILNSIHFLAWDKPPFTLLNLLLSFIAAFQAPFIMMSQNRAEAKQDEAYRQLFYEIKDLVQTDIQTSDVNKQELRELKDEVRLLRKLIEKSYRSI